MLKYTEAKVVFREVPDEITLAINISNCPCHCAGCHSPYLAEDIGEKLKQSTLLRLCDTNKGITCVSFMGGDSSPEDINYLAFVIRTLKPNLLTAWYSGRQELSEYIDLKNFNFIKLGPYIEELGPLTSKATNQRFYKVNEDYNLIDITNKFWK